MLLRFWEDSDLHSQAHKGNPARPVETRSKEVEEEFKTRYFSQEWRINA